MRPKHKRLILIGGGLTALAGAAGLVLWAFSQNLTFFFSPTELAARAPAVGQRIRLGGLVEQGSVERQPGTMAIRFRVTDLTTTTRVAYEGILPDLFREGQGVVAEGALAADGSFRATTILAKHDENYMPPEVAEALKKSGHWEGGAPKDKQP